MERKTALGKSYVERTQSHINTKTRGDHAYKMRGRYVKAFTIISLLLASTLAFSNSYAQSEVVLNLAKRVYVVGESVIVSGIVPSPSTNVPVIIQVWNPSREACSSQQVNVSEDGSFIARPIKLSGRVCSIPGTYTITGFYGENEGAITFEVQAPVAATQNGSESLQTLLDILNKAKQNVDNKIRDVQGKGIKIPDDVMERYEEALVEVQETEDSVAADDVDAAKQHARNAMSSFREVFTALTLLEEGKTEATAAAESAVEREDLKKAEKISELRQAIVRAIEFKNRLTNIATASNIDANFDDFDSAIGEAAKYIDKGDVDEAARALAKARQILSDIHKSLMEQAKEYQQLKAREFVEKTVNRINEMIETAKAIGMPQDVIDALENAKVKLLAAKNVNEILLISKELKGEKAEYVEHKGKNFERAVQHLESKLQEAKRIAEQAGMNIDVFDRIQGMIDDATAQWAAGETKNAINTLEKAEHDLRQLIGIMERTKHLLGDLNKLANAAEELKEKAEDNEEALNAIDKAMSLINGAKETLMNATSEHDILSAHEMYEQAKQLLERVRHTVGSKVAPVPGDVDYVNQLKRMAQTLEDRAERLEEIAEKQQNREAVSIIMEAINIIRKAKQMISEENYDDAKQLLDQANELLNNAERMLKSGTNVTSEPTVSYEQAKKAIMQEIQMLEAVAADLKSKAGDNEKAHEHINEAIEDLNDAKGLVREGHLDKAKSKVNDAKEHLHKAKQIIDNSSYEDDDGEERPKNKSR